MGALSLDIPLSLSLLQYAKETKQYKKIEFIQNVYDIKENVTKSESGVYLKNELSDLENLLSNFKKLTVSQKENLIKSITFDNTSFNFIISEIYKSPNSYKLDLLLSCLCMFDEEKYERVIDYIKNSTINNYIRSFLIEAISNWDKIDSKKRKLDLKNVLSKENNKTLQKIISDTISDIE